MGNPDQFIVGTWTGPETVICRLCIFRDRTVYPGITKAYCDMFPAPPESPGKPLGILMHGDMCPHFRLDDA